MKKFLVFFVLSVSLFCIALSAVAGEGWIELGRDEDAICSLYCPSIKENNGKIYAWVKIIYRNDRIKQSVYNKSLAYSLERFVFDINDNTFDLKEHIYYNSADSIIYERPHRSPKYTSIIPDSSIECIFGCCKAYLDIE